MVRVFGIVNVTRDSFSDGGRFLAPEAAIAHAEQLRADGADAIDLGAESTHPDAEDVSADEEILRLEPVVRALLRRQVELSIDTHKPAVMRAMLALGVQWLNDVGGFRSADAMAVVAAAPPSVRFIAMFSTSAGARAARREVDGTQLLGEIRAFFAERVRAFAALGVAGDRLVLDPGMGFFLGRTAGPSLAVLRHLAGLAPPGVPLLVSVSRKSFVGEVTGRPVHERGAGTLAAELWAARAGAAIIRTHDPLAFQSAWRMERGIADAP